jgi:transcriptional regulator with XRE-family HTH domain
MLNAIYDIQDLGAQIATLRKNQGLSQTEVARRAGVSRAMLSDLETGQLHDPGVKKVLRLLTVLGLGIKLVTLSPPTLDDLLADQEDSHA